MLILSLQYGCLYVSPVYVDMGFDSRKILNLSRVVTMEMTKVAKVIREVKFIS